MTYEKLIKKEDVWEFIVNNSLGNKLSFHFDFLPNQWFKEVFKQYVDDNLKLKRITLATLHRYNYSTKHFFSFIEESEMRINKFEDLTYKDIQLFIAHLKQTGLSRTTQSVALSSLKSIVEHGMVFEYEGFPKRKIFDGREYSRIGVEDTLHTKYISDDVMDEIEEALNLEPDQLFKTLLIVVIDTGARIGELLELETDDLLMDFTDKPVLEIKSTKNNSERYIPVSRRVYWSLKRLIRYTEELREEKGTNKIFIYRGRLNKIRILTQKIARDNLSRFLRRNNIQEEVTFHSFRHTLGTDMLNNGMSIFEIQDYLGQLSSHSTAHYAKIKNPKVQREYNSLGFIGKITEKIDKGLIEEPERRDENILKSAALPDGACSKPIDNQGIYAQNLMPVLFALNL